MNWILEGFMTTWFSPKETLVSLCGSSNLGAVLIVPWKLFKLLMYNPSNQQKTRSHHFWWKNNRLLNIDIESNKFSVFSQFKKRSCVSVRILFTIKHRFLNVCTCSPCVPKLMVHIESEVSDCLIGFWSIEVKTVVITPFKKTQVNQKGLIKTVSSENLFSWEVHQLSVYITNMRSDNSWPSGGLTF